MADQKPSSLTDQELIELANDASVTAKDLALLSPDEARRYAALRQSKGDGSSLTSKLGGVIDAGNEMAKGAVKGAGETAFNLGNMVHSIPGIGNLTDMLSTLVGPEGTNPDQAFSRVPEDLKAANTAQAFGKGAEQIGEFFLPAGKVGMAQRGAAELVGSIPKAAGTVRKIATDAAWKMAPVLDNALATGGVALAHGDEDPQYAAGTQAGLQTAGLGLGQLTKLLETKVGSQYAPILAAILVMKGVSALGGGLGETMGSGLAANTATRTLTRRALQQPGAAGKLLWGAEKAGERAGTLGAGVVDETRRRRRDQ